MDSTPTLMSGRVPSRARACLMRLKQSPGDNIIRVPQDNLSLRDEFKCLEFQALKMALPQTHLWVVLGGPRAMGDNNRLVGTPNPARGPWSATSDIYLATVEVITVPSGGDLGRCCS